MKLESYLFLFRASSVVDRGVKLRHGLDLIGGEISVGGLGGIAKCNVIQRPKTTTVCECGAVLSVVRIS